MAKEFEYIECACDKAYKKLYENENIEVRRRFSFRSDY